MTVLWQDEPLSMDADRLAGFLVDMGEARAEMALTRAVDEIDVIMQQIQRCHDRNRHAEMVKAAHHMCDVAEPLGFSSLAQVARDISVTAGRGDQVALEAVLARLRRVLGRTLKMVWDLRDLSG